MHFTRLPSALVVVALVVLATTYPVATATLLEQGRIAPRELRLAYVSPALLSDSYWRYGGYVENPQIFEESRVEKPVRLLGEGGYARAILILEAGTSITSIRGKVRGVLGVYPVYGRKVVTVLISRDDLSALSKTPGVVAVLPDVRFEDYYIRSRRTTPPELLLDDTVGPRPVQYSTTSTGAYHYTINITRAIDVWTKYGVRGSGVKIAIVDTGVDYGSPALGLSSIARDEYGLPLVFDADSYGLVLTPVEGVVEGTTLYVDVSKLYVFDAYFPAVYREEVGVVASWCGYTEFDISTWDIGNVVHYGTIRFGLAVKNIYTPQGFIWYTLPVILVDSDGDGLYDTLHAAVSLVLYYIASQLAGCGITVPNAPTEPLYVFDSGPITYGNEVIAVDLDGDGVTDFSAGALAGYVYDSTYAIIYELLGIWREYVQPLPPWYGYYTYAEIFETWGGEPVAFVWPGLDFYSGSYVVLSEDFYSHGTFCATTAAGRDFYAATGYGTRSIAGQAPEASVASATALWLGNVLTSIYFFSGFDVATPYGIGSRYLWPALFANPWMAYEGYSWEWAYTGRPLVDMTSNSYGISAWALWGWASGMDPVAAVFDYTSAVSGVAHFVAVGNGGPGWGTITTPGASSLAISVGAATEFTYLTAYGYPPGANSMVITWSNRGPTELGTVKPDVLAVGAYAWAVGRTWDSLLRGVLNGAYAYDLFGGTSQATPMAAGVAALVVSTYKQLTGSGMPAYLLKTVLMNSARDVGFDELSQGAGLVDAYRAASMVLDPSIPRVCSREFFADVISDVGPSYAAFTYGTSVPPTWYEPKIYVPHIAPGSATVRTLEITGSGTLRVYSVRLTQVSTTPICSMISSVLSPPTVAGCSGDTLYVDARGRITAYAWLLLDLTKIPRDRYLEFEIVYPYEYFNRGGRVLTWDTYLGVADLWYWVDFNRNGAVEWWERTRLAVDVRGANSLRLQLSNLGSQMAEVDSLIRKLYGIDTTGLRKGVVLRVGLYQTTVNSVVPFRIRLATYIATTWPEVTPTATTVTVSGTARLGLVIRAPTAPGFYSGYLVLEDVSRGTRYRVPVSYFVPVTLAGAAVSLVPVTERGLYRNYYLRGAFDWTWRYESGDWRVFKVSVPPGTYAIGVRITYPTYGRPEYSSNVDSAIFGPTTYYMVDEYGEVTAYTVTGALLGGELSRYFRRAWDYTKPGEVVYQAPAVVAGTYRLVIRNIGFSGATYEEPLYVTLVPVSYTISMPTRIDARYGARGVITFRSDVATYLPKSFTALDEALYRPPTAGTYYLVYLPDIGITVSTGTITVTPPNLRVELSVTADRTRAYNGYYVVGIEVENGATVLAIGYEGTCTFCWSYSILYYRFELIGALSPT